jgi:uncharacterized protein (DUF1697 family)
MPVFAALLRAINVSGTGKLLMSDLTALCEDAGFSDVKTYIQSGNVVFKTRLSESKARAVLEKALTKKLGVPATVILRSCEQLEALVKANPFKTEPGNRVAVIFMNEGPSAKAVAAVVSPDGERLKLAAPDLFVHYPNGMGTSKLKLPFAKNATARNINTVAKLASMTRALHD